MSVPSSSSSGNHAVSLGSVINGNTNSNGVSTIQHGLGSVASVANTVANTVATVTLSSNASAAAASDTVEAQRARQHELSEAEKATISSLRKDGSEEELAQVLRHFGCSPGSIKADRIMAFFRKAPCNGGVVQSREGNSNDTSAAVAAAAAAFADAFPAIRNGRTLRPLKPDLPRNQQVSLDYKLAAELLLAGASESDVFREMDIAKDSVDNSRKQACVKRIAGL
ncbi:hypothetical protein JYU14_04660, partial [Simkania negevensis]|nr:hypothetical protein [Simkania negevensis]